MKKYLIEMKNGSVRIMTLISGTVEESYSKWRDGDQVASYQEIEDSDLPKDRIFRNAWTKSSGGIKENLPKSREIIREHRNNALDILDGKVVKESRKPDGDMEKIDKEAQRLRDIPQLAEFKSRDIRKLKALYKSI